MQSLTAAPVEEKAAHITVRGLTKHFKEVPLYENFDIDFPKGKIVSIFGPNGCGKSTFINMVSGLLPFDSGKVLFDGKSIAQTRIGYVFQNYREALFPWMRAVDNVIYPLRLMGLSKKEIQIRMDEIYESFSLKFDLNRYPYEMSGGQQQTVCIMRALIIHPEVLFLDEPFSALDYEMTLMMRDLLQKALAARHTTALLVSHDLEEAIYLADRLLLLTRRPTRIASYSDVPLPRPRAPQTVTEPHFVDLKAEALAVFQEALQAS